MKNIKWKILYVTCIVTLLPMLLGLALWDKLPPIVATHFNFYNQPDGFSPKGFAVFGLPFIMCLMQIVCCISSDVGTYKHKMPRQFERVVKWIVPAIAVVVQSAILAYGMGIKVDIRKVAMLLVGAVFIAMGNYMPKLTYIKNYALDAEKARKINRFLGFGMVVIGLLFCISIFLPPIFSVCCLFLLIPYILVSAIYGICVSRK